MNDATGVRRNRTLTRELAFALQIAQRMSDREPACLTFTIDDGKVVAVLNGGAMHRPIAGRGHDAKQALQALNDHIRAWTEGTAPPEPDAEPPAIAAARRARWMRLIDAGRTVLDGSDLPHAAVVETSDAVWATARGYATQTIAQRQATRAAGPDANSFVVTRANRLLYVVGRGNCVYYEHRVCPDCLDTGTIDPSPGRPGRPGEPCGCALRP